MNGLAPHLGEICALLTAIMWATAVILFKKSGEAVHPLALSLFKSALSILLLLITMNAMGLDILRRTPSSEYLLLLASGILGIGMADTLFFSSLNILGAGLSAIVGCLYSPFIIGLSILFLGESLTPLQVLGVVMILSAVLAISFEKNTCTPRGKTLAFGIALGALALATNAIGIVMIKPMLSQSPLFWVMAVRTIGGGLFVAIVVSLLKDRRSVLASLVNRGQRRYTVLGSLMGGFGAMILWLAGMKFTQASTAAALNQTSNIFVFTFAAIFLREPITRQRVIGIVLGVAGAFLVTFGS